MNEMGEKLDELTAGLNEAPLKQTEGVWAGVDEMYPGFASGGKDGMGDLPTAEKIDTYYRALDERNANCRFWSKMCALFFFVVLFFFTILYLVIVRGGYQKLDPIVGNVQVRVRGVVQQSPAPSLKDAAVYDAADLVVPSRERNAVFIATNIFTASAQSRFDAGSNEHKKCADIKPCKCEPNQPCSECGAPGVDTTSNGLITGQCINIAPSGGASKPDKRCEVKAWCPVAEVDRIVRTKYQADQEANGIVQLKDAENLMLDVQVNGRAEQLDRTVQHKQSLTLQQLLANANVPFDATKDSGAIIYGQVSFDCNLDFGLVCDPRITYVRMDEAQLPGSPMVPGYHFQHVRYSNLAVGAETQRVRHVEQMAGYRIVFDINGNLRQFDFGALVTTLSIGLAIGAVGFLIIDQTRQNLERIYLKSRADQSGAVKTTVEVHEETARLLDEYDDDEVADVDFSGEGSNYKAMAS